MKDSDRQFEQEIWVEMTSGKSRGEIKKICAAYVLDAFDRTELAVFRGIVSGDGDIGGRMASGHPDAKPPVSNRRMKRLDFMAAQFEKYDVGYSAIAKTPKS